jgi:O-antigen ligase
MHRSALAAPLAPGRRERPRLDPDHAARARPGRILDAARHPILLAPRALLTGLFSFETLLVLYMFAGIYKGDPRFAWIPADATALFFAPSVLVGSFILVLNPIHKKGLPVVFAMICLVVWFLVGTTWSPSRIYGPNKVFLMATLELWAVIAGALIIAPNPERVRRLFTMLLVLSVLVGVDAVLAYGQAGGDVQQLQIESGSYLTIGRICGLGALVAIVAWLSSAGRVTRWLCLGLFFALGFTLVIGGGRGPLLSTALPLLFVAVVGIRLTTRRILYSRTLLSVLVLVPTLVAGLALYGAVTDYRLGTIDRLQGLLSGKNMGGNRPTYYFEEAPKAFSEAPLLGHGAGAWAFLVGRSDVPRYPHNLFVELLVEGGLVALGLFLALLGAAFRPVSLERLRRDPQALCVMLLFLNTFLNAMVSGDLPGNRAMFMLIGLLALFAVRPFGEVTPAGAPTQEKTPLDLSRAARPLVRRPAL